MTVILKTVNDTAEDKKVTLNVNAFLTDINGDTGIKAPAAEIQVIFAKVKARQSLNTSLVKMPFYGANTHLLSTVLRFLYAVQTKRQSLLLVLESFQQPRLNFL